MSDTPIESGISPSKMKLRLVQTHLTKAFEQGETSHDNVLAFIAHHRRVDEGHPMPRPFRHIAIELSDVTGVDVTHEAVRRWHRAAEKEAAAAARQAELAGAAAQ